MRFFAEHVNENYAILSTDDIKHIRTVLRLRDGDNITICDGNCTDFLCKIAGNEFKIISSSKCVNEPAFKVHVYQCLTKMTKLDEIIQKCVELGACSITPVFSEYCVPTFDSSLKKAERWQKVAESAAKQCNRGIIPEVRETTKFDDIINKTTAFAYENAEDIRLNDVLKDYKDNEISILVGPEGGFSEKEVQAGINNGAAIVTLGKRILRTETAAPAMLAIIMNIMGEI